MGSSSFYGVEAQRAQTNSHEEPREYGLLPANIWRIFRGSTMSATITRYFYGAYSTDRPCRQLLPATFMVPIPRIDHFGGYYPLLSWHPYRGSTILATITRYFMAPIPRIDPFGSYYPLLL